MYRSVSICFVALNLIKTSLVTADPYNQISKPMVEKKQKYRNLRTSMLRDDVNAIASMTMPHGNIISQEHTPSRRIQDVYEIDSETGSIYINGEKTDGFGVPDTSGNTLFDDDYFMEICDGFKFELDENGFCQVSTGYIMLMVFINISIIIAIVIASCACCKCCVWYPYLCCASDAEQRPQLNQHGNCTVRKAAYPVMKEKQQPSNVQTIKVKKSVSKTLQSETQSDGIIDNAVPKIGNFEFEC